MGGFLTGLSNFAFGSPDMTEANAYGAKGEGYLKANDGVGDIYKGIGQGAFANYQSDNPAARQATQNEINSLGQNPYATGQGLSTNTNQILSGQHFADTYQRTRAALANDSARRGFDPGSSTETGGMAALGNYQANAVNQAQQQAATMSNDYQRMALGQIAGITGQQAAGDLSTGDNAYQRMLSANNGQFDGYLKLGGMSAQAADAQYKDSMAPLMAAGQIAAASAGAA